MKIDLRLPASPRLCMIHIGAGLLDECASIICDSTDSRQAVIVCDSAVAATHAQAVHAALAHALSRVETIAIECSEERKTLDTASSLYTAFLKSGLDRSGCVVAIGGGIVTDIAGLAPPPIKRGLPRINITTTLLGMVDAAIGGKTGVNVPLPGSATLGKNLVGAFHHPAAVIMDVDTLATLPPRAFRCGLAECIKHALIADPPMLEWLESHAGVLAPQRSGELVEFIARNVRIKADVVIHDEKESSQRMVLNLGHTFAHAIETRPELHLEHGEAVALGLLAACAAGEDLGLTHADLRPRLARLIEQLGLPSRLASNPPLPEVLAAMRSDKKSHAGSIRLIIPVDAGVVQVVDSARESAIAAGMKAIAP